MELCHKSRAVSVSVDLLANDMWAMGVILVCMLAGYSMFGIKREDRPELRAKLHDQQTEWDVAIATSHSVQHPIRSAGREALP